MRVLILGSDTPLGQALVERQALLARHETVLMSRSACRWKSERQAKKSVVRAKCDIVVDVRIEAAGDGGEQIQELDLKRCHWVAKACQRTAIAYLYLSSSRVFSGQLDRPYTEEDFPDNEETVGQLLSMAEQLVRDSCERHIILRLGPIFSYEGTNLITQMLGPMRQGGSLIQHLLEALFELRQRVQMHRAVVAVNNDFPILQPRIGQIDRTHDRRHAHGPGQARHVGAARDLHGDQADELLAGNFPQ